MNDNFDNGHEILKRLENSVSEIKNELAEIKILIKNDNNSGKIENDYFKTWLFRAIAITLSAGTCILFLLGVAKIILH